MKNIIIISAHPDDEILGAGGTLLKHKANGDLLAWLIITNITEEQGYSPTQIQKRQSEIERVKQAVGFSKVYMLNYPTMSLDSSSINKIIPQIASCFNEFKPEVLYVMNRSDAHSDHRYVFEAVMACTKSFRYPFIKQVLMYECISETEFSPALSENMYLPNYFVDITDFLTEKIKIMMIYSSEMGNHPFPRSINNIEALATFRGATAGVKFAESFQLIKFIDK